MLFLTEAPASIIVYVCDVCRVLAEVPRTQMHQCVALSRLWMAGYCPYPELHAILI